MRTKTVHRLFLSFCWALLAFVAFLLIVEISVEISNAGTRRNLKVSGAKKVTGITLVDPMYDYASIVEIDPNKETVIEFEHCEPKHIVTIHKRNGKLVAEIK